MTPSPIERETSSRSDARALSAMPASAWLRECPVLCIPPAPVRHSPGGLRRQKGRSFYVGWRWVQDPRPQALRVDPGRVLVSDLPGDQEAVPRNERAQPLDETFRRRAVLLPVVFTDVGEHGNGGAHQAGFEFLKRGDDGHAFKDDGIAPESVRKLQHPDLLLDACWAPAVDHQLSPVRPKDGWTDPGDLRQHLSTMVPQGRGHIPRHAGLPPGSPQRGCGWDRPDPGADEVSPPAGAQREAEV